MPSSIARWSGSYGLKLLLAAVLIALADRLFYVWDLGDGWLGVFAFALLAAMVIARPALRRDWRAWIALSLAAVFAAALVWDAGVLAFMLFWTAAATAALLPHTARFDDGWRWFQRLLAHTFKASVGPLLDWGRVSRVKRKRPAQRTSITARLRLLGLPLVGSAVIIALFAMANPVLEQWLAQFSTPAINLSLISRCLLAVLVGWLSWSLLRPRATRHLVATFDGHGDLALPGVSQGSVLLSLIAFNALFALQNAMDLAFLGGLMELPKGMTLADYAHRGAYPLIVTALLAGLFVLVTLRPGSSTAAVPAIRALVVLWIVQNLVLVGSSVLRTLDYVQAYSLTVLRISALAWMGLVALGLVLVCWRMLRGNSAGWLINANLAAAGALLTVFSFADPAAIAAHYNVNHAREAGGTGPKLDLCYLDSLGGSALLALVELEQRPLEPTLHGRISRVRIMVQAQEARRLEQGGWTLLRARRLDRAAAQGAKVPSNLGGEGRYDCEGWEYQDKTGSIEPATEATAAPPLTETGEP